MLLRREILKPLFCIVQGSFIVDGGGGDGTQERNLRNETRGCEGTEGRTVGSGNHEDTRPYPLIARVRDYSL